MEDKKIEIIDVDFDESMYIKNVQENEFNPEYEEGIDNANN